MRLSVIENNLTELIVQWAHARNLIEGSDPKSQFLKLMEEVGELAGDIARKRDKSFIADDIGDAFVVLTIIAAQYDLRMEDCIRAAWLDIKDRKGRMVDGVFVKESDTSF